MKRNVLYYSVLLLCFCSVNGISQTKFGLSNNQLEFRLQKSDAMVDGAVGSPYIFEEFVNAKVDDFELTYKVRFNGAGGVMEFKDPTGQILVISNEEEHIIRMQDGTNRVYETVTFPEKRGMAQRIWSDESGNALYAKEHIEFRPEAKATNSYGTDKPARYDRADDAFYYKTSDMTILQEVPTRRKDFLNTFDQAGVKEYLKDQKTDLKSKEDLIKFFKYYYGTPK